MKILFIEDKGSSSEYLLEYLTSEGHEVLEAVDFFDAISFWEEGGIDCIILDLNIDPAGLKKEEIFETKGGVLSGWVWFVNYVLPVAPKMHYKTIIYTDYFDYLKKYVDRQSYQDCRIVEKRRSENCFEEVIDNVNEIERLYYEKK